MSVRVRFAPSPTGHLHIGGARTALYNWLFARKNSGEFILRIEDTDEARSSQNMVRGILDGLSWLGIDWDEGPYFQSRELQNHRNLAARLLERGHAYRDFSKPGSEPQSYLRYRQLSREESDARAASGESSAVRFSVPENQVLRFEDRVFGKIKVSSSEIADFVILRSDQMPTYHLSVVADDIQVGITHVIRGADHLSNTAKHILLYQALEEAVPIYTHLPLIFGPDKRRLSKRHGAASVAEYSSQGYFPEAVRNYLALLGWSPGDDTEIFSLEELISRFDLSRINKANAIFDFAKLDWMNKRYLSSLPVETILPEVKKRLIEAGIWEDTFETDRRAWFIHLIELLRVRAESLDDLVRSGRAFFTDEFDYDPKALKKYSAQNDPEIQIKLKAGLAELRDAYRDLNPFDQETTESVLRAIADTYGLKTGLFIGSVRVACTGVGRAPGIFDVLVSLGREKTLQRLNRFLKNLG